MRGAKLGRRFIPCLISIVLLGCAVPRQNRLCHFETERGALAKHWKGAHVQGFACAPDALYLGVDRSGIFKFSWEGRLIKHVDAPNHTGDIFWYEGKLYTSVDVLEGPRPSRSGIVQVYDGDLNLVNEAYIEQGIDGICAKDGMLYLGMNNTAKLHRVNQIGRMNATSLEFIDRIDIDHGYETEWGTQNLTTDGERFWVQFYSEMPLAVFDAGWQLVRALPFRSNQGFDCIPHELWRDKAHPRFASGRNFRRGEDPAYGIDFYEFDGGQMVNVTAADAK